MPGPLDYILNTSMSLKLALWMVSKITNYVLIGPVLELFLHLMCGKDSHIHNFLRAVNKVYNRVFQMPDFLKSSPARSFFSPISMQLMIGAFCDPNQRNVVSIFECQHLTIST